MPKQKITLSEVGPRDGLQSIDRFMPLADKQAWVAAEAAAGVSEIEVGAFVSPRVIPQMAETAQMVAFAHTVPNLTIAVLVPNLKGAQAALAAGAHKLGLPLSASEEHSRRNVNRSHAQMIEEIKAIAETIKSLPDTTRPSFDVSISTAFGCSISGPVAEAVVIDLAVQCIEAGADEICLSDTTGSAHPAAVRRLIRAVGQEIGGQRLTALHLHNTRGLGLANALAGIDEGITTLDASLGGLGGCPAAPGASGNIVTEDLAFMLDAMGFETGIDLDRLVAVRDILHKALPGEPLYGFVPDAGLPEGYKSCP